MFNPMTSPDTGSATSSPASQAGPLQLDLLGGPTPASSGPAPRRVSRSASPDKDLGKATNDISGLSFFGSSEPSTRLQSSVNRSLRLWGRLGSTECSLTWKQRTTPAGRSYYQLAASMRPIAEIDFGSSLNALWPTPMARDHFPAHTPEYVAEKKALGHGMSNLNDTVASLWPTPSVACATGGQSSRSGDRKGEMLLGGLVRESHALWPSPTASLSDKGIRSPEGAMTEIERGKSPDLAAHVMAMWSTPSKSDAIAGADFSRRDNGRPNSKVSTEVHLVELWGTPTAHERTPTAHERTHTPRPVHHGIQLANQANELMRSAEMWRTPRANDHKGGLRPDSKSERPTSDHFLPDQVNFTMWPTPSARDWKDSPGMAQTGVNPDGSTRTRLDQLPRQVALYPTPTSLSPARNGNNEAGNSAGLVAIRALVIGAPQSGSSEQTEKPGALAPDFVAWLMGYPPEWLECAPESMPKSKSKRSLSSPTASKRASANSERSVTQSSPLSEPKSSALTSTAITELGVFG